MALRQNSVFRGLFGVDRQERLKLLLLAAAFFLVIASYTVVRELKDSIFIALVGRDLLPDAKIYSMFVLVPAIIFYAYLVDRMRRYKLLYFYSFFYGLAGLTFAYFLGDPVTGLANTQTGAHRLMGWLFYFFIEGYSPFVVSLFWAFSNSISSPESAKRSYGFLVSGSKLGGAFSAALAWYFFSTSIPQIVKLSDTVKHQVLIVFSSVLLLCVPILIYLLIKLVPGRYLHGYEAAYQIEKERAVIDDAEKPGLLRGLLLLLKFPYVMGIFGIIFFYEVSNVILSYQRLILASDSVVGCGISALSCKLFEQIFWVHTVGFVISFFGTTYLLNKLGERWMLLLIPLLSGFLMFAFVFAGIWLPQYSWAITTIVFVGLRAINYGATYPVRESLYIPTIKDVKFKSKSWIDAFGTKIAKGAGSGVNILMKFVLANFGYLVFIWSLISIFGLIVALWMVIAQLLGKRYDQLIKHNEVVGAES
ncbi:MAG TPA: Npt1/Npt2 family nucleotide transporter [Candidatus Babeliales bacterium]|nr:Npt1/Npt2 family nucleotide transporter [Candidatus Babeliales bacterium]